MLTGLLLFWFTGVSVAEEDAAQLFHEYKDRIFQIRVIDQRADKKVGLGSGFLAAKDDLIATNFHVISRLVHYPDKYRAELENSDGVIQQLELVDIDVINDLALLRTEPLDKTPLHLPRTPLNQGDTIYSIGNPYDIGFTVIPGTFNGIDPNNYYPRIHFSGAVNPGMSGGPVLNRLGEVVGINVSTAGNQISFLIPDRPLKTLLERQANHPGHEMPFAQRIRDQLVSNQQHLISDLLKLNWPVEEMGAAKVLGEIEPFVKCWGESNKDKELYRSISRACRSKQSIYLEDRFNTGVVSYQFLWLEAGELSASRFLSFYRSMFGRFYPDNRANEENVGNFVCEEQFVKGQRNGIDKLVLCARAYKKYPGLYDWLYLRGSVDQTKKAFVSHFTLSGVDKKSIEVFQKRFMEEVKR